MPASPTLRRRAAAASWWRSIRRAPPGPDDERADEIGVVVAARGDDGHAYVLADRSLRDAPAAWGRAAAQAYRDFDADCIIAEENFGGDMVRYVIRAADRNARVQVITASRGKVLRAEPVSALYEQGLVHHVGRFAVLEDQLCAFTTQGYRGEGSPDHADALVFAITELMLKEHAPIIEYYRLLVRNVSGSAAGERAIASRRPNRCQLASARRHIGGARSFRCLLCRRRRRCRRGQGRRCRDAAWRRLYPCR